MANYNHQPDYEEDLDCIDFQNYKGVFFNDEPGFKYQDEITGAHFEYRDMCRRLEHLKGMLQRESATTKDFGSTTALGEFVSAMRKQKQRSAASKEPFRLIPQVQAMRNGDARSSQSYSTTVDVKKKNLKGESSKGCIPRNHSIVHKKASENASAKEMYYAKARKGERAA
eukprot:TRINITY_DN11590_c0_g1_i1.p2 TRINITY_DN11590_c0_g1~~TRINITY_DN11590_c0_g1_i1.p2  ORF type:complete len:170 (+),score=28.97 TRINITY_DN11590_c0_g1_i1:136-645(+)